MIARRSQHRGRVCRFLLSRAFRWRWNCSPCTSPAMVTPSKILPNAEKSRRQNGGTTCRRHHQTVLPLKGIKKLFGVTDDEMNPGGHMNLAGKNWAHQHIPLPASPAIEEKVRRIVQFLMETPSLNPESVAEFLSHPAVFPLQVCRVFMEALPIAGRSLVEGLRKLFSVVQLPKGRTTH
ncbi:hypothetical protein C3747_220g62 [Trypanosoma cruzi]|uniref:SEC7 domain-containing protein n=1 Tax=Trypanosoma cruzi TaxID=5693 RepID=A0A2V2VSG7_TRYCR|nr:hypothetical protein C3747_220g62 [Trypanosoma cruzi]